MYDFYFGSNKEINQDPKRYLLAIKRMLPRWCNSIPDSEYMALYDSIAGLDLPARPVFLETGSGASTIVLAYFAIKAGGELYTWDTNGSKLFFLRSVMNDTLMRHFSDKNLTGHWRHIAFDSNSEYAGIKILKELRKKVTACFLDSEHTLDVLMRELKNTAEVLDKEAIVAIDDANYTYRFRNTSYINMIRKKHGLPPVLESSENIGRHFWEEVHDYLIRTFRKVEYLKDSYKKNYKSDLFWSYFNTDREIMSGMQMEKTDDLEHRFDAWKIQR